MGKHWTNSLARLSLSPWAHQFVFIFQYLLIILRILVNIDGPYGKSTINYGDYDIILLVCGGVGVLFFKNSNEYNNYLFR